MVMTQVAALEVNPFAENTYIVWDDETLECAIVDPGVYTAAERRRLQVSIAERQLKPVRLLNTHAHLDHVFGNAFVHRTWGLLPELHEGELSTLEHYPEVCRMYGIPDAEPSPMPSVFLLPGEELVIGHSVFRILFTPGHSPASVSLYCEADALVLSGDVLFWESIGRSDLPGGSLPLLESSIRQQLYTLPPETVVYPGHGPATSIRHEKAYNPFVSAE